MSSFCSNCGTATGGGKFCPKCGAVQGTASAGPSISQSPYAVPVKRKSPVLKIVLIVLALFFVLGIAAVVKGYFFLKETYHEAKQEMAKAKGGKVERTQAGCEILGKEQVATILGTAVPATKGNEAGDIREFCNYLSTENVAAQKDDDADSSVAKQILNGAKNKPLLGVQIYRGNAGIALIAIKTAARLSGQGAVNIPGPWEEAYFGPQDTALAIRKGQNGILIDLTQVSKRHDAGLAVAKAMMTNF